MHARILCWCCLEKGRVEEASDLSQKSPGFLIDAVILIGWKIPEKDIDVFRVATQGHPEVLR